MPLCAGIYSDLRGRLPHYFDDWRQGLSFKCLSATLYIFFTNVLPAMSFASLLSARTGGMLGVAEVLLSMGLGGLLFAFFAGQPLIIVGVTGPISIFCATLFDLSTRLGLDFLGWLFWVCAWSALMHVALASANACSLVAFVTPFSGEIFGMLISVIYAFEGVREFARPFTDELPAAALLALALGAATFTLARGLAGARGWLILRAAARGFFADYGPTLAVIVCSAAQLLPRLVDVHVAMLPVPAATGGRTWAVPHFWEVPIGGIFAAALPAAVLTALLFFDHNVSSALSQRPEFGLKKPSSYNWDFALLGVSVLLTGLLGLPPNYGLIPQAPLHVRALADVREESDGALKREVWVSVCETRASAAGAAALTLALLSPPGLAALSRVPLGVLAGQFLYLAAAGAAGNGLAERAVFLAMDPAADVRAPYARLPFWRAVFCFTTLQLCATALIFGVTLSPGGVVFPVLIVLLVPARIYVLPRLFSTADLAVLDPMQPVTGPGRPPPDDLAVLDPMEPVPGRLLAEDSPLPQGNGEAWATSGCVQIDQ